MMEAYPYEILPGLWIGNADVAKADDTRHQYSHVLNMAAGLEPLPYEQQQYLHIKLEDLDDITPHLDTIYAFVSSGMDHSGSVLVHCAMGKNRSAAACLAVLAKRRKISTQKALKYLQSKAPFARPALWFQQQVAAWLGESSPADGALAKFKQRLQLRKSGNAVDPMQLYYQQCLSSSVDISHSVPRRTRSRNSGSNGKSRQLWRYQLVNGLEQVLYDVFSQHLGVARAATAAMRLGNNFLGSLNYVWPAQATQLAVPRSEAGCARSLIGPLAARGSRACF
ncbi:Putative dual specificity phosphatase [Klebsormidium nitens]|uniref:protein-tyrosine-phosphatase n=1 Tax=Klebsormidium nitens TaxID=105231 RepID=A0A1Y1HRT6_KLENI|nr:Putative dual specificity phosphatase [Klebsormidium nitens]|eukprot:GAQ79701.1 Putative dual specificity phosphatase [Klebsormidium nitens]